VAIARGVSGQTLGRRKVHRFRAPPRQSSLRLALYGFGAALAGRRDGRQGIPRPEDAQHPASVKRRVERTNAWMNGKLAHRYHAERSRLLGLQTTLAQSAQGLGITVPLSAAAQAPPDSAAPHQETPTVMAVAVDGTKKVARSTPRVRGAVQLQSTIVYVGLLLLIFVGEAVINKKAFELFSESDQTLWVLAGALGVVVVIGTHLNGRAWKRSTENRGELVLAIVLTTFLLGASVALGVIRYLSVDHTRTQTVQVLQQEVSAIASEENGYVGELHALTQKKHPSVAEKNSIVVLQGRIASDKGESSGAKSELIDEQHPTGIDRAIYAIPVFALLNLFLIGIASALAYAHYDADAERRRAEQRTEFWASLRRGLKGFFAAIGGTFRGFIGWWQRRMQRWENRRINRRLRKQLALERGAAAQRSRLVGYAESLDETLVELRKVYTAACAEAEKHCEEIIQRYWAANNHRSAHDARKAERLWRRANLRAIKHGRPELPRPAAADWQQPYSQTVPLAFQRPTDLAV
jgi:hypothetical protein